MGFFQNTVVNKYLKTLDKQTVSNAYNKFKEHFFNPTIQENIRNSKEEQYQEGFLIDLFVNILGYTKNPTPDFNLTTEYKNIKDSKKVDGAIVINEKVIAVVELKGTDTTDLSKVENQAFGYKNNQPACVYVIISNFEKLRFYIDNAIEHIEFNLFTLTETEFELLYLCLAYENIAKEIPKKIKAESLSHEDIITKKLYNDYSLFKRELHQNLVKLNPQFDALTLFKKSQKLLDRFLFLFFAEDKLLLPPNSVRLVLNDWKDLLDRDVEVKLYHRFKVYFGYLNKGFKGKRYDVFAYNGGLFLPDEILDALKIDDDLLYNHILKLSDYDFASEIDVNILGHIFENSLNELDEIKAQLEGNEIDKGKTKRKKDGIFYTPKYITKYIVDNTVGRLCNEKKAELQINEEEYIPDKKRQKKTTQDLVKKLTEYRNWLLQLKICDPACGSGAFLNQALDFLITEHRYIDELQAKLFGDSLVLSDIENSILENNLFGVDLNEESVEIARLSLWLRTAHPNRKLNDLSNNIKCGNSLIDDPAVAGEKAFNWFLEFPQVFPNYREKDQLEWYERKKRVISLLPGNYSDQGDRDFLDEVEEAPFSYKKNSKGFEKHGFDVVIGNPPYVAGKDLSQVNKDYFKSKYSLISGKYDLYILFVERILSILKEKHRWGFIIPNTFLANENSTLIRKALLKKKSIESIRIFSDEVFAEASVESVVVICSTNIHDEIKILKNTEDVLAIANADSTFLDSFSRFQISISDSDSNILSSIEKCSVKLGSLCEICIGIQIGGSGNSDEFKEKYINIEAKDASYKKCIDGKDFEPYYTSWSGNYISYGDWLHRKRDEKYFLNPKIMIRQIGNTPVCNIDFNGFYTLNTVYNLIMLNPEYDVKTIYLLMNSKLLKYYWQKKFSDSKSLFPKIKKSQLIEIPISENITNENNNLLQQLFDKNQELHLQFQSAINKFISYFSCQYNISKQSNKLSKWYDLEFASFINELNKAIKTVKGTSLTKKEEFEWIDLFNENKQKLQAKKAEIEGVDIEIDNMVYQLYGITREDIKIIEANQ